MNPVKAIEGSIICLGRVGENLSTQIQFDYVQCFSKKYGNGVFQLSHQRKGDTAPYAVNVETNETSVLWNVRAEDVAKVGAGECQLHYIVDNIVKKTVIFDTKVERSLGENGPYPDPWESYHDDIVQAGAQAAQSAAEAKESEENAQEYADNAAASAEEAKGYAEEAKQQCEDIQEYVEQAEEYANQAEQSANSAEQSASDAEESATNAQDQAQAALQHKQDAEQAAQEATAQATTASQNAAQAESSAQLAVSAAQYASISAESAELSKRSATAAEQGAQQSATQASTSASQASSSASSASASATSASSSASTASTKASEASASATSAQTSATQASASADSASASAQSAETAKDEVEAIAENIETLLASKVDKTEYDAKTAEIDEKDASQDELIASLEAENRQQAFQIADLKNIVYDTVVEDAEYTYDDLDVAPIPTHVSDGTNYHKVFDGAETMLTSIDGRTAKVNQLYDHSAWNTKTVNGVELAHFDDGSFTLTGQGTNSTNVNLCDVSIVAGHKYLLYRGNNMAVDTGNTLAFMQIYGGSGNYAQIKNNATVNGIIWTAINSYADGVVRVRINEGTSYANYYVKPKVVDLTKVYDAGNEPTEVAQVLADNPWILETNELILGELRSSIVSGVQINGANLWNEEWEAGGIDASGRKIAAGNTIRSKDFIKVLPKTVYWCVCPVTGDAAIATINFYDANGNFISRLAGSAFRNAAFTTPNGCYNILFRCDQTTSYTSGIAFYRSNTALPYRPYSAPWEFMLPVPETLGTNDVIRFTAQDTTWNVEKVEDGVTTTLMTGLTEPDIATLIELNGSVEVIGNTNKQYVKPDLNTIIQAEKAVINA